jgi:uncharacterized damage-inducible protein DinB
MMPPETLRTFTMLAMVRLDFLLDSWKTIRQDAAQAVEDLPAGELDFKPAPDLDSFRQIVTHIINAGNGLTGLLLEGEEHLTGPDFREKIKKYFCTLPEQADAALLAAELRQAVDARTAALAQKSPEWYSQIVTRVDGQKVTRMEMLQFVKEHELTHRAQLFMYLRLKGVVPVTTRRRLAMQAKR